MFLRPTEEAPFSPRQARPAVEEVAILPIAASIVRPKPLARFLRARIGRSLGFRPRLGLSILDTL